MLLSSSSEVASKVVAVDQHHFAKVAGRKRIRSFAVEGQLGDAADIELHHAARVRMLPRHAAGLVIGRKSARAANRRW